LPSGEIVPIRGFSGFVGSGTIISLPLITPLTAAASSPVIVTISSPASFVPLINVHSLLHGLTIQVTNGHLSREQMKLAKKS
jgi:hypothetical protein